MASHTQGGHSNTFFSVTISRVLIQWGHSLMSSLSLDFSQFLCYLWSESEPRIISAIQMVFRVDKTCQDQNLPLPENISIWHHILFESIYYNSKQMYNCRKKILVAQSCPTLCNRMDCSPQAPLSIGFCRQYQSGLPFSRGSSWPGDWTWVSCIGTQILYCLSR